MLKLTKKLPRLAQFSLPFQATVKASGKVESWTIFVSVWYSVLTLLTIAVVSTVIVGCVSSADLNGTKIDGALQVTENPWSLSGALTWNRTPQRGPDEKSSAYPTPVTPQR